MTVRIVECAGGCGRRLSVPESELGEGVLITCGSEECLSRFRKDADVRSVTWSEDHLSELLDLICGRGKFTWLGGGITSYFGRDDNQQKIHDGCLELESRGLIERHLEEGDYVVWKQRE